MLANIRFCACAAQKILFCFWQIHQPCIRSIWPKKPIVLNLRAVYTRFKETKNILNKREMFKQKGDLVVFSWKRSRILWIWSTSTHMWISCPSRGLDDWMWIGWVPEQQVRSTVTSPRFFFFIYYVGESHAIAYTSLQSTKTRNTARCVNT